MENNNSFLNSIKKRFTFEADEDKNQENVDSNKEQNDNRQLDKELSDLKDEKSKQDDQKQDTSDKTSDKPDDTTDEKDDLGDDSDMNSNVDSSVDDDFGGDETPPSDSSSSDMNADPISEPSTAGPNNRLTLFDEYLKISNVIDNTINSLEDNQSIINNTKAKIGVTQLQAIYKDIRFIIDDKFYTMDDKDLMIHLEILKKRFNLVMEALSRIKNNNPK